MTVLIEKTGNLFTSKAMAVGHGVNTKGSMGAGIAKSFREAWPDMYERYNWACMSGYLKPGGIFPFQLPSGGWIYNIASQQKPGPDARLSWLSTGVCRALFHALDNNVPSIALPQIGCGIGGLRWPDVHEILSGMAELTTVDIEVWSLA